MEPRGEIAGQNHLDLANQAYEAGSFDLALREYRNAYDLCRSAMVFRGVAHSEWKLGRESDAAHDFQRFLREAADAEDDLRQDATIALQALAARLTSVTVVGAVESATVLIDGHAVEGWARGIPIYLSPGSHTVRIERATAAALERTVTATIGGELRLDIPDEDVVAQPVQPPPPPVSHRRWWLWGGIATALIAGAVVGYVVTRPGRPDCPSVCP